MLYRFFCVFLLSFCFSSTVFNINGVDFSENYFYSFVSKGEWSSFSSQQKNELLKDYLYKKLVFLETKENGFFEDPYFSRKLKNRTDQFLVNAAYDVFVAYPLVDSASFETSLLNAKKDVNVSHLLLGYKGCRLPVPINRTKQNTFIYAKNIYQELFSGEDFNEYVKKYSDDPSIEKNNGNLGWLSWGRTVPEFQSVAFSLEPGQISKPVLTDFGYHIIKVEDVRSSQASLLDSLDYLALCTERSIASVPLNKKRSSAENYDKKTLLNGGLVFNNLALSSIYKTIIEENNKNKIIASGKKNLIKILSSIESAGVVCVFNNNGYGVKWFSDHFSRLPATRIPTINSLDDLRNAFKLAVLQQLSLDKISNNFNDFSFLLNPKIEKISENLVYESYIKYIINNINEISKDSIVSYYNNNKFEKYIEKNLVEVREIKTLEKSLSDSLYNFLKNGESFVDIAKKYSLTNPRNGGLISPFTKNRYGPMGKKAFTLSPGSFSKQIENLDGTWSIIFVERFIEESFIPLDRVEIKIKSLLKKEYQKNVKNNLYTSLFNKYSVWINPLFIEENN